MPAKVRVDFEANTRDAKNQVTDFRKSFTEFKSTIDSVETMFSTLQSVWDQTAGSVSKNDTEIKDLARDLNLTTEETSRLIGMSATYGVSSDQLSSALEMMVKRGVAPNVEELAKMSDEFLSIQDPVQRAAMMSDKLGRNWTSLNGILEKGGAAIRGTAAALDPALIRTQEQVDQTEQLEIAFAQLNLKIEAFKIEIFGNAIPALVTLLEWTDKIDGALEEHGQQQVLTTSLYSDYATEMKRAASAAGYVINAQGDLMTLAGALVKQHFLLSNAEWAAARAQDAIKKSTEGATQSGWDYEGVSQHIIDTTIQKNDALHNSAAQLEAERVAGEQTTAMLDQIAQAQGRLESAQRGWLDKTGGDWVKALEDGGVSGDKLNQAMGLLDQTYGTSYLADANKAKTIKDAVDQFKRTGDLDAFRGKLDYVEEGFMPLDESIKTAQTDLNNLNLQLANMNGTVSDVYIVTHHIDVDGDQPWTPPSTTNPNDVPGHGHGTGEQEYANGTNDAPGGLALVGEHGPEVVNLPPHSQVVPSDQLGGIHYNGPITFSFPNVTNYQEFQRKMAADYRSALKSGKGYSGTR